MRITPGVEIAGQYVVERELSKGGMGSVYVATDRKFDKQIALKVAAFGGVAFDDSFARFKREAKIGNELGRATGSRPPKAKRACSHATWEPSSSTSTGTAFEPGSVRQPG